MNGADQSLDTEKSLPQGRPWVRVFSDECLQVWRHTLQILLQRIHDLLGLISSAACDLGVKRISCDAIDECLKDLTSIQLPMYESSSSLER